MKRIAILGSSRGLGWATFTEIHKKYPQAEFVLASRKIQSRKDDVSTAAQLIEQDFAKAALQDSFYQKLLKFNPDVLIYCAGGGPYAEFHSKKWSDHQWAFNVNFLYPAELLHRILQDQKNWLSLSQLVFIGSRIAENQPDPKAASYAAAKHALRGLITTVQQEGGPAFQVKLFSPGYMETDLLPVNSAPRLGKLAESPSKVAQELINFIESRELIS